MVTVLTSTRAWATTGRRPRFIAVAVVIGLATTCLMIGTGLLTASPHGAGDNGDGVRLYCGAGIVPTTQDKQANWKGVVVDTFRTGEKPCARPMPSSALLPMIATARLSGPTWNLRTLGWTWIGVLVAAFGVAAAAAGATRPWRALVVVPVVLPLASPDFSRFLLSTYGEPAGLVGTAVALAGGVAAVAGPSRGLARPTALAVSIAGGLLAATGKPAYAVVLIPVLLVCVTVPPAGSRLLGLLIAAVVALGTAVPVIAAVTVQDEQYGAVNTHNLVFTAVGPASQGDALDRLGLPPAASRALGSAFYPDGGRSVPNWEAVVGDDWPRLRAAALGYVLTHPRTALHMVDGALRAASNPRVTYLPADLRSDPTAEPTPVPDPSLGEQGAYRRTLDPWLAGRPLGVVPWFLLGAAIIVGAIGTTRRWGTSLGAALTALCVTATAAMALVAVAAVMGDGYFEIAKHTWLAAYAGAVAIIAMVSWAVFGTVRTVRARPPRLTPPPEVGDPRHDDGTRAGGTRDQEAATTAGSSR
jgi:hypothetical protein